MGVLLFLALGLTWLGATSTLGVAAATPYSEYVLSPKSRTLIARDVFNINGSVDNAAALTSIGSAATFNGVSAVTYDFGKNVAGIVSFSTGSVTGSNEFIGISFTESSLWIADDGCDAMADLSIDAALWYPVTSDASYQAEKKHQRGAFRYLNVYHNTTGTAEVANLTIHYTATPQVPDDELGIYKGYFHSSDEKLNRVWYAGAYTTELCTIDPTAGDSLVWLGIVNVGQPEPPPLAWWHNYTITNGTSCLVDGAKRDRLVWPGDMSIAVPTMAVSTYYMDTIANSITAMLWLQDPNSGMLPYASQPFWDKSGHLFSYTYHLHTLNGIYTHYLWTGDKAYLSGNWAKYKFALGYSLSFVDSTGMAYVPSFAPYDWLRSWMGGHNIEANAILYYILNQAVELAQVLGDTSVISGYQTYAANIKTAVNTNLWDASANMYRDNDTTPLTSLHPQDGNAWAIVANLTDSAEKNAQISAGLRARWGKYGPPAPEAPDNTVSPFISGFELQAHYLAGNASASVELMQFMWHDFMLEDPRMTNSTFIEGYQMDGTLHYIYYNDQRVSFTHGWATGPTSALTMYGAGLQVVKAGGQEWKIAPSLGGLQEVEAGFATTVGSFSVKAEANSTSTRIQFVTPTGTTGTISLEPPAKGGTLYIKGQGAEKAQRVDIPSGMAGRYDISDVEGGEYDLLLENN